MKPLKPVISQLRNSTDIPGLISKSSLFVLASVLVACVGNVETSENDKQDADINQAKKIEQLASLKEYETRDDWSVEEIVVTGARKNDSDTRVVTRQRSEKASAEVVVQMDSMVGQSRASAPMLVAEPVPMNRNGAYLNYIENEQKIKSNLSKNTNVAVDPYLPKNNENYAQVDESAIKRVSEEPVSTFSVDVDTGSYTNVRRMLNQDYLPPADAVRVEEFINYFDYNYKVPRSTKDPFSVSTELSQTPWNADSLLLKVGLKAYEVDASERPAANLVFLMDVSGSMNSHDKLPLLKQSFEMLTQHLTENDSVSIVVYAGASGVVLEPTSGDNKHTILESLHRLRAGGSTNGAAGIQLAYQLAEEAFIDEGINRIMLATDGDFNVGTSSVDALKRLIEDKREKGISLTTLGFGTGNYNDHLMEQLADVGNGNNAYIDSVKEAEKVLVTEMSSTLLAVAKDVKIQVEFNPSQVSEYRLIGYENRVLQREDFNNDKVDAGEIGAGHTVTVIYEIFPSSSNKTNIDPLRYAKKMTRSRNNKELAFVKLRFKYPYADKSTLRDFVVNAKDVRDFSDMSQDFKFATAVSAFGQKLKRSKYIGDFSFDAISELAEENSGKDRHGYRNEFVGLVEKASELIGENPEHLMSEY